MRKEDPGVEHPDYDQRVANPVVDQVEQLARLFHRLAHDPKPFEAVRRPLGVPLPLGLQFETLPRQLLILQHMGFRRCRAAKGGARPMFGSRELAGHRDAPVQSG